MTVIYGERFTHDFTKNRIPVELINAHAMRTGAAQTGETGVNVAPGGAQQRRSRCEEDDGDRHYRRWHLAFPVGIHCEE